MAHADLAAVPAKVPTFSQRSTPADFVHGFGLFFSAFRLIFSTPKLLVLSLLSAVVTLGSLIGIIALLVEHTGSLVGYLVAFPDNVLLKGLWYLLYAVVFVVLLVIGANTIPMILLSPLQDPISESTEAICGGFRPPPFSVGRFIRGVFVSVGHSIKRIAVMLFGHALLIPLNLVPGIGSAGWSIASIGWTIFWLAGEYLDGPMARHMYRFRELFGVLTTRLGLSLGFGAAVYLALWVPVLNLFFIPAAIVGGTLLFRGLQATGDIKATPS